MICLDTGVLSRAYPSVSVSRARAVRGSVLVARRVFVLCSWGALASWPLALGGGVRARHGHFMLLAFHFFFFHDVFFLGVSAHGWHRVIKYVLDFQDVHDVLDVHD